MGQLMDAWSAYLWSMLAKSKLPHGPVLPEKMPWIGDIFILEREDGKDQICAWMNGGWDNGPILERPKR